MRSALLPLAGVLSLALAAAPARAAGPRPHVLLVVGAAGAPEYAERFRTAASLWQKAARRGEAEVTTIGLDPQDKPNDRALVQQALAQAAKVSDRPLWLVLIGHGTFDGRAARFNLRGPDLTEQELAGWLSPVRRPLILINSASASAPFLKALAGPDRILVTATRSGNEMNAPRFGGWLAEAIADTRADLDRDGGVSLLEAFLHASKRVETSFTEEGCWPPSTPSSTTTATVWAPARPPIRGWPLKMPARPPARSQRWPATPSGTACAPAWSR